MPAIEIDGFSFDDVNLDKIAEHGIRERDLWEVIEERSPNSTKQEPKAG